MLLVDKHENIDTSLLVLSMRIFNEIKMQRYISYNKLLAKMRFIEKKRKLKKQHISGEKFIWALMFLYACKKIIYHKDIDIFTLNHCLNETQ